MTLSPRDALLLLSLLGEGQSAIRPGSFTAEQALVIKARLKARAEEEK